MVVKTSIFTSQPIINKDTDIYHGTILNSIKNEMLEKDPESKVRCTTQIKEGVVFIFCEIIADSAINTSEIARNNLNKLFRKSSLFPSSLPKTP
jgi:S-adenosylmethionine synthetase